jgi:hypothetical protein
MQRSRLTPLQDRVLHVLGASTTGWTLTGGAALAGFHTMHRSTRDLELFWHGRAQLGEERAHVIEALESSGLIVETLQASPSFARVLVRDGAESVAVDLVAEPVAQAEQPQIVEHQGVRIRVDSAGEILVNKLNALLQRSELRDLQDVRALLERGGNLAWALEQAGRKDRGFSSLTISWVLREMPVEKLAGAADLAPAARESLLSFRDELVRRIAVAARPSP